MIIINGIIILISVVSVAYIVLKTVKLKIAKYLLALVISVLYGAMLFFIGMSINAALYYILAIIPLIAGVFIIFKQSFKKKN